MVEGKKCINCSKLMGCVNYIRSLFPAAMRDAVIIDGITTNKLLIRFVVSHRERKNIIPDEALLKEQLKKRFKPTKIYMIGLPKEYRVEIFIKNLPCFVHNP